MTKEKLITGIVLGAAVGAIVGFLFATEKGAEIRKQLADKGFELGDLLASKASEFGNVLKDEFGNVVTGATNAANQAVSKGKEMAQAQTEKW